MPREIEFKIFDNGKWYYKCLVGNTNNTSDDNWTCPLVWSDEKKDWVHCDNGVICQYTGLKDKNGVKIFEGDIVIYKYQNDDLKTKKLTVFFDEEDCSFSLAHKGKPYISMEKDDIKYYKVIGNIYENKELLV